MLSTGYARFCLYRSSAMKEINITTLIKSVRYDELTESQRHLVDAAKRATERAYAPYSKFNVGAAILLANGETVSGANQENAAYPSGTCAERTACYYASAEYPGVRYDKIAIAAYSNDKFQSSPISPCGACRQALLEYETLHKQEIEVILYGEDEIFILPSVASLLPLCFKEF